jgi:hypothetical protein
VASLVIGILSVTFGFVFILPPVLAIVFGAIALPRAQYQSGVVRGRSMAVAGVILGVVTLLGAIALYSYLGASGRIHKANNDSYPERPVAAVVVARPSEYPLVAPGE